MLTNRVPIIEDNEFVIGQIPYSAGDLFFVECTFFAEMKKGNLELEVLALVAPVIGWLGTVTTNEYVHHYPIYLVSREAGGGPELTLNVGERDPIGNCGPNGEGVFRLSEVSDARFIKTVKALYNPSLAAMEIRKSHGCGEVMPKDVPDFAKIRSYYVDRDIDTLHGNTLCMKQTRKEFTELVEPEKRTEKKSEGK